MTSGGANDRLQEEAHDGRFQYMRWQTGHAHRALSHLSSGSPSVTHQAASPVPPLHEPTLACRYVESHEAKVGFRLTLASWVNPNPNP